MSMAMVLCSAAAIYVASAGTARAPAVYDDAKFEVQAHIGVPYAMGVLCNATKCKPDELRTPPYDCSVCQAVEPQTTPPITPTADCTAPRLFNLTLDMYTPMAVPASLGPRPALVLTHEGNV